MDKTAPSTFSSRSYAKRAAEKLLAAGTAPAVDYGIKERQHGRSRSSGKPRQSRPAWASRRPVLF